MLLLFLGFLQIAAPSDRPLLQQSERQATYYLKQIDNGTEIEENLWALTTLSSANEEIKTYVEHEVKKETYSNNLLKLFQKIEPSFREQLEKIVFNTGSRNLLVALLLESRETPQRKTLYNRFKSQFSFSQRGKINYGSLFLSIIEKKRIARQALPADDFLLPHFFLFYYDLKGVLISEDYAEKIIQQWGYSQQKNSSLSYILFNATLLRAYYLRNQYSRTSALYNYLIQNRFFPNSSLKLRIYRYLDYSMYRLGYYDRSLNILREFTLPLSQYLGNKKTELSIKELNGVYLYSIGKIKKAEQIFQNILVNINIDNPEIKLSSLYNNLALTYYKLGKYDQYLEMQFRALSYAKEKNNYTHQINILNNLFIYYRKSNNPENALTYLQKARILAKERNYSDDLGTIYTLFGSFYREFRGEYQTAHNYYSKAAQVLNAKNNRRYYIKLLNEEAETYEEQHLYRQALEKHDQILALTPEQNNPNHIDALVNKALLCTKMGNLEKALQVINQFKSYDLGQLDFDQIVKAKTVEANYLDKTGHLQKSLNILNSTLSQVVERAKGSADLKSGFWHVEDEYLDAFSLAISINIENGHPAKAVELLDQLKTINDASLYQNPLVKSSLLNESELTQYKQLTAQLDATRKKLLTAPEDQKFDIRQAISQLKLKKRKLDKKLTNNIDNSSASVRNVQNKLSAHDLVLHVTELNDKYYIAQISRSNVKIRTIPLDSKLRNLLLDAIKEVSTHEANLDSLYAITQLLDLKEIPDRIQQITIIPDSYLYQLPIDILPLEKPTLSYSYGEVTYVIEKFRTHYLTSLNDFDKRKSDRPKNSQVGFAGYGVSNFRGYHNKSLVPLPYAQTEVSSIAHKLTNLSGVRTFINQASTKKAFTETASKAQIIHLATHSEVSEKDPMFSTVYLSKDGNSADSTFDDQIFAYELFELNLNNEMIMFNSCESGSGSYIQGTGVMGISRALQYAGANSLILNLWSVNDMMASEFAVHFYDQLNQGKSKSEALRNTKRYFLRTKNASPHFWGPYMLIGNTDPIVTPDKDKNLAMAGAFIFYFLLMVGLSYLNDKEFIFKQS